MITQAQLKTSFTETFSTFFSRLTIFIWASAVVVATVAGPFGTFEAMLLPDRALFWAITVSVSIAIGYSARALAAALVGPEKPFLFDTVAVLSMTLVFGPMVWGIAKAFHSKRSVEVPELAKFFLYVFVVTAAVFVIRRAMPGIEQRTYWHTNPESSEPNQPRLMRRLSPAVRGDILRLSSRDHHVEVVTKTGCETLRLRMADAIDDMDPVEGFCIHRSHWVARDAVIRCERENSHKVFVILSNGERLPISRTYRPKLEEMGFLD